MRNEDPTCQSLLRGASPVRHASPPARSRPVNKPFFFGQGAASNLLSTIHVPSLDPDRAREYLGNDQERC